MIAWVNSILENSIIFDRYRNKIFCVTDPRVPEEDLAKGQNIFVYFALGTQEKSERMEKFLKENNFLFLMSNDFPFLD